MVRRILVTGANKGIGLAISRRCLLDHDDTSVVLGCRSVQRGAAAVESLVSENAAWRARVQLLEIDTSSDASVTAAASKLTADGHKLYAVCNNAGIAAGSSLAEVFEVNTCGPRRVDAAFMPLLDPKQGRIVQISSGAASQCVTKCSEERKKFFVDPAVTWPQIEGVMEEANRVGVEGFEAAGLGAAMGGYGLSKALLNSYTVVLAREHPSLSVNACSPGMIQTDIIGQMLPWFVPTFVAGFLARKLMGALTPDQGTVAPMKLLFGELDGNGRYYGSDGLRSPLDKYRSPGSPPYEGS
tara:strand:+ start:1002 stop:1895 length:894 start_codon:yes stop_codon:yes gene_type:complete